MLTDPFLKALEELLEDQIDSIRFEKINPAYAAKENRKAEIIKTLKTLPETLETKAGAVKVHDLLIEFDDLSGDVAGIIFNTGIKRGFSLAFKLIFHNLTM